MVVTDCPGAGFNYGSSPGPLPTTVRERFCAALSEGTVSPLSVYHRGEPFAALAERLEEKLRRALKVPGDYRVLFLQGGATAQFAMVPLNLGGGRPADYLHTGYWSGRALKEAVHLGCKARCAASWDPARARAIPARHTWQLSEDAAYLYYTDNETVEGMEFPAPPQAGAPLIADMSSNLLTRRVDVGRHGLIFAGAQKNLGVPGLTVVLVRAELLCAPVVGTPSLFDYRVHEQHHSLYNTPVAIAWCVAEWMLDWLEEQGGAAAMETANRRKAEVVYAALDAGDLYRNDVAPACRSRVNVAFDLRTPALRSRFLAEAAREGLDGLAGHHSHGGLRAALYNAMPLAGAHALAAFLTEFERRHG